MLDQEYDNHPSQSAAKKKDTNNKNEEEEDQITVREATQRPPEVRSRLE